MYNRQPFSNNDPTLLQGQMNQQRSFSMNQPLQQQPQLSNASLLAQQLQQSQSQSQVTTPSQQTARLNSSQTSHASNTSSSTPAPTHISMPTTPSLQPAATNTTLTTASTTSTLASTGNKALNDEKVYSWINELVYGPNKEQALLELGKKRELYDDLALVLWNSFGVMTSLLEEIVTVYSLLSPPNLNTPSSNRVCNALALLQCVASHPDTRTPFLNAQIPLFLYPFLNTNSKQRPFEYLRLTSLGVIGALVKNDTPEVIQFLLTTEIIPLCLKIMESSSELSKTVAIFIVQKILIDDAGLSYICQTFDRFDAVSNVLKLMIDQLVTNPTGRLLKHVIRCYLRLADNPDAGVALRDRLPEALKDNTFSEILRDDAATKSCLAQLLSSIQQ